MPGVHTEGNRKVQNSCRRNEPPGSPWECLSCGQPIDYDAGAVSLDDSTELHCCAACWAALTPAERLEARRKWRLDARTAEALEKFGALADGALSGFHIPGYFGPSERN